MIRGFYAARTGLIGQQHRLDTIANNLANVNTLGFKPMRTSFKDLIYQNVNRPAAQDTAMVGAGVKVNSNDILMRQGAFSATYRDMDLALTNEGDFFAVESGDGNIFYTRAGNFYIRLEDGGATAWLVNADGLRVLDADGSQIELELVNDSYVFDPTAVGVYRFPNAYGLDSVGNNTYVQTERSGEPEPVNNPQYIKGYTENSAVDIAQEMVYMIESQRAFSLSSRMVQTADEIENTINNLR